MQFHGHMMHELIEMTGKLTFLSVVIASVLGIFRWKLHKMWAKPSLHFFFAGVAIISGSVHLVLNLIK